MKDENKKNKMDDEKMPDKKINNEETNPENLQTEEVDERDLKIGELEKEIAELKDKYLRKLAEFENYKRRIENEQMNLIKYSAASFIKKILPVIDDFERSLDHIEEAKENSAIKEGLKLIYDKLKKALDDEGVKKIEAVGKPFDVNYHEAVMQRADDSVKPHTVLEEIEKGYLYRDKVIRHSKVIVSEEPSEEPVEKNKENSNKDK